MPKTNSEIRDELNELGDVETKEITNRNNPVLYPVYATILSVHILYDIIMNREEYDVIHTLDYYVGLMSGILVKYITDTALIISIRGLPYPLTQQYVQRNGLRAYLFQNVILLYHIIAIYACSSCIFKSRSELDFYNTYISIEYKSFVIPTGVDLDNFAPSSDLESPRMIENDLPGITAFLEDSTVVLFAGRVKYQKGVHKLIEHHYGTEEKLIIIGKYTSTKYGKNIESKVRGAKNVQYYNKYIDHKVMPHILSMVDAVALLSLSNIEGNPKILQESLAIGTPIIGSNIDGIKLRFSDIGGAFLINANDTIGYRNALSDIKSGNYRIDQDEIYENFNMQNNYQKISRIYNKYV